MTIREFMRYHLPLVAYATLVLVLSSIPDLSVPIVTSFPSDKIAHFCEYAIFAGFTFRSFSRLMPKATSKLLLFCILFLTLFALADEYYQHFIPGRQTDLLDFAADIGGGFLVLFLLFDHFRRVNRPAGRTDPVD